MDSTRPAVDGNSIELSKKELRQSDLNTLVDNGVARNGSDSLVPVCDVTGVGSSLPTDGYFTKNNNISGRSTTGVVGNPGLTGPTRSDSLGFSNISLIISPGSLGRENGQPNRDTDKYIRGSISDKTGADSLAQQCKPRQFLTDKSVVENCEISNVDCITDFKQEEEEEARFDQEGVVSSGVSVSTQDVASTDLPSAPPSATPSSITSSLSTLNLNLDLPPAPSQRITNGFGVRMVSTSSSSQSLIYRSIPPRPLSYTLTDVLDSTRPGGNKHRSKTAPVSTNAPEDYAQRFKSRPTTRPKVIEFDGTAVSSKPHRTLVSSGFPTARARIYIGQPKAKPHAETNGETQSTTTSRADSKLQLQPLSRMSQQQGFTPGRNSSTGHGTPTTRTQRSEKPPKTAGSSSTYSMTQNHQRSTAKSAASSGPGFTTTKSTTSSTTKATENLKETSQSIDFTANNLPNDVLDDDEYDHIHNPDLLLTSSADCDDISTLPRPKKILPRRELPWVFRYKVKRGMNTLSRIMASKPPQGLMQPSHAFS